MSIGLRQSWAALSQRTFGRCIRSIPVKLGQTEASPGKALYLTFDDGPDPRSTPRVLEVLSRHHAQATFFTIATKAVANPDLTRHLRDSGHAIGNHSLDHHYKHFFLGKKHMLKWLTQSEEILTRVSGTESVGFRPPAGVRTPELAWALERIKLPLVLWDARFYDTLIPWSIPRARRTLTRLNTGSIILLHDAQRTSRIDGFLETLSSFLETTREHGFKHKPLTRELCQGAAQEERATDDAS